jgi:hypothetical protein
VSSAVTHAVRPEELHVDRSARAPAYGISQTTQPGWASARVIVSLVAAVIVLGYALKSAGARDARQIIR